MAKLGNFLQVTDIRGSIGGNVFSKARNGGTLRARVSPRNPRTTAQLAVRALVTSGSRAAAALSHSNRDAWISYAATITLHNPTSGAAYTPSWMQVFVAYFVAFNLATPGGTAPSTPPAGPYTGDTITLSAGVSLGAISVTGSAQQTSGSTTFIYAEKLKGVNRAPSSRPGKLVSVAPIPSTPFKITLTSLTTGEYAIKARYVDLVTGQMGPVTLLGVFAKS